MSLRASYDQGCEDRLEGTGTWFTDSEKYRRWRSSDESDLLWVKGKPGCGKSILAAVAVTDLKLGLSPGVALAYAFCRNEDESTREPSTILGALAKQIGQELPDVDPVLESEYLASQPGQKPTHRTVQACLQSVVSPFKTVFIVIDALDECQNNKVLAQDLLDLMRDKEGVRVKIAVFSRPDYDLENFFKPYMRIRPDDGDNQVDLEAYIGSLFPDEPHSDVNRNIRAECVAKANGMFLWVSLLWKNLPKGLKSNQKLDRVKKFPPGLGNIYNRILQDIWEQDEDIRLDAFHVLLWVTHARRALTGHEMLEAVADYSGAERVEYVSRNDSVDLLVSFCKSLVFIDKDGYFRLCHESVRDHLDDIGPETSEPLAEYRLQKQSAHERLASTCLTYLLLGNFECGPANSLRELASLVKQFPFLGYAAEFWGWHAAHGAQLRLHDSILELVHSPARRELSMQIRLYDSSDESEQWKYTGASNPLHILAVFGLKQTAETVPGIVMLSQQTDASGATPLTYAMMGGHYEMSLWINESVQSLNVLLTSPQRKIAAIHLAASRGWTDFLKNLISENQDLANSRVNQNGPTALGRACVAGELEVAALMIDNNADVDLRDASGFNPLLLATICRHNGVAKLLLERGANPNCRDDDGGTPLHHAAFNINVEMTIALLERGADPVAKAWDAEKQTPLQSAVEAQSLEVIKVLHNHHSQWDVKSGGGYTALHTAALHNSFKAAQVLLELGAPRDEVNGNGETALFVAAEVGAAETVKVLLEAGCDVNIVASDGRTAIHAATSSGKLAILDYILSSQPIQKWKAMVNEATKIKEQPIHIAISRGGRLDVVKFLLNAGGNAAANGILDSSALHYAAHFDRKAVARLLLLQTRDPNPRNEDGDTPLHFAARAHNSEFIVQFLRDCATIGLPVQVDAENNFKKTALMIALIERCENIASFLVEKTFPPAPMRHVGYHIHEAAWHGYDSIVQVLLNHEGIIEKDESGRTPLFCAALRGHLTTSKLLSTHSAAVLNEPDERQMTPVLAALCYRHVEVASYLLDLGADHYVADEHGNTQLHAAADIGDLDMVKRLLDLGCRGDTTNRYGATPFHNAVDSNNGEVVDELTARDFNAVSTVDSLGNSCIVLAAGQGNLEMLQKLIEYGARFESRNLLGRTPAYVAASNGHWEILDFLKDHGDSLTLTDNEGNSPLMGAASDGYPETVKYLVQHSKDSINSHSAWSKETALSEATKNGHHITIGLLLAAGADPYHRDGAGVNALDLAAAHWPTLQEMHKARHFYVPTDLELRDRISGETVRRSCEELLSLPEQPSVAELYRRIWLTGTLERTLLRLQDWDAAKVCTMELLWPPKFSDLRVVFSCDLCGSCNFSGDKYLCKSCYRSNLLCSSCHSDYNEADRGVTQALREVMVLEEIIQPVRVATAKCLSVFEIYKAMHYYAVGSEWTSYLFDEYEIWEQKFNSKSKYRELERPGQELLKMVKKVSDLANKVLRDGGVSTEDKKEMTDLERQYERHRRKCRPDKERLEFICRNHEYLLVSADEYDKAKAANKSIDSHFGRLTPSFLEHLVHSYSSTPGVYHARTSETGIGSKHNFSQDAINGSEPKVSDGSSAKVERGFHHLSQRPNLQRAVTAVGKPLKLQKADDPPLASTIAMKITSSSNAADRENGIGPRRAQTLPITVEEAKQFITRNVGVEMKDTRYLTAVQMKLVSQDASEPADLQIAPDANQKIEKTVTVAIPTEVDDSEEPASGAASAEAATSTEGHMLTLTLSSEPEAIEDSQAPETAGSSAHVKEGVPAESATGAAGSAKKDGEDEEGDIEDALQTAFRIVRDEDETDEDVILWLFALDVTDAMFPGFITDYWRAKHEERVRAAEEEDRRHESGKESDKDGESGADEVDSDSDDD